MGNVTIIGFHYDGVDIPASAALDEMPLLIQEAQEHIDRDWGGGAHGAGIMYHYVIGRDHVIRRTAPEGALLWAANNANPIGLWIKVTSGPNTPPDSVQMALARQMADWLTTQRPDIPAGQGDVWGHGELTEYGNSTACPGQVVLAFVKNYRQGE